jgi:hypothetical protein
MRSGIHTLETTGIWVKSADKVVLVVLPSNPACDFSVLRARCLVFTILSLFGFTSQQYTSNTKFSYFFFIGPDRDKKEFKKGDSQTKDQKTLETRWKHPGFRNGLGTVRMVYEATTIAHRTPPALAVTTVGGTCGVLKTLFWPNIASAHPSVGSVWSDLADFNLYVSRSFGWRLRFLALTFWVLPTKFCSTLSVQKIKMTQKRSSCSTPNNEELGPGVCQNIQTHQDRIYFILKFRVCTPGQMRRLKYLGLFGQNQNRCFCMFFRANLTVLGVLVGSAGG